jgi:signal recognition particle receptor subunit beta
MANIDFKKQAMTCKLVFYGTGLGGKTTNLKYIYEKTAPKKRGKLVSLETETERTLFFDFFPMAVGKIKGLDTRFSLYTVPGQSFYNLTRKAILKDADGVVFVADSQEDRLDANVDSILNLKENLESHNIQLASFPHVIQYNKRDLPRVTSRDELVKELNLFSAPDFDAVATDGTGVFETLKAAIRLVIDKVTADLQG